MEARNADYAHQVGRLVDGEIQRTEAACGMTDNDGFAISQQFFKGAIHDVVEPLLTDLFGLEVRWHGGGVMGG